MASNSPDFDVALSFAGEDRAYVSDVAIALKESGIRVFYDEFETVGLWGRDLYSHLDTVYRKSARFCVMFISQAYAAKVWTNHERRSAQARAISENREYVLPARFDDTEIEGLLPTIGYVDLSGINPSDLATMIIEKVGPRESEEAFPRTPDLMWKLLEVPEDDVEEMSRTRSVADAFYRALSRMSFRERQAVCGVLAFGCPAELPEQVHISLDLLHRMTGLPKNQLLDALASVHSLNIKTFTRELQHEHEPGELVREDDRDIVMTFWSMFDSERDDGTDIAHAAVQCATQHFCEDHGLEVVVRLDFSRLSSMVENTPS